MDGGTCSDEAGEGNSLSCSLSSNRPTNRCQSCRWVWTRRWWLISANTVPKCYIKYICMVCSQKNKFNTFHSLISAVCNASDQYNELIGLLLKNVFVLEKMSHVYAVRLKKRRLKMFHTICVWTPFVGRPWSRTQITLIQNEKKHSESCNVYLTSLTHTI